MSEGVWVEFYGGPWDGEMREVEADAEGVPTPHGVIWHTAGVDHGGVYRAAGKIGDGLLVRMAWREGIDPWPGQE
jgi:hypothetical protein